MHGRKKKNSHSFVCSSIYTYSGPYTVVCILVYTLVYILLYMLRCFVLYDISLLIVTLLSSRLRSEGAVDKGSSRVVVGEDEGDNAASLVSPDETSINPLPKIK